MKLAWPPAALPGARSMRRSVAALGALLIAAIVALAVFDIVRSHRATVAHIGQELDAQARIIAEHTARSVQAVDVVLRHLEEQQRAGALDAMSPLELHNYLREQAIGLVQIRGLLLVAPDGMVRAASIQYPLPANRDLSGYAVYKRVRDDPATRLVIDAPIFGIDQEWAIPIVRRLDKPDGSFNGAVVGRGRVEYFQKFYRDIHLDSGTSASLMHRDGTLLARYPPADQALGQRLPATEALVAAHEAGRRGAILASSPIDGVDRYIALQTVPDFPLAVVVTRDAALALADWREQAWGSALRTLLLAGLAAWLLALVMRQLARLDATRGSLERAQERFALAVEGSDDGIWDWDRGSGVMFASARAREILGMPPGPQTQPADAWFAALRRHPDDAARHQAALEDHLAGRTPAYAAQFRVLHPDGRYRWVSVRGLCVRDAAGRALRMAGSVTDIDAQRRAEEALRTGEERYTLAVAGSNDGIVDWDIVNDRMFTSPRVLQILGLDSDVTLRTRAEWVALLRLHPDDVQRHAEDFERHLRGETDVRDGEYRVRHPDGVYRWVRVRGTSVRDASGKAVRWAGSISDIDTQKRTEQALRRSEERYQLAVAGSNEGLWDWDMRRDELFISPRAQELLGVASGEPVRPRREWIERHGYHPDDRQRVRAALSAHLRGETSHFVCEYRMRHASGDWHWYRQRGVAVRDAQGRPYRVAGSMEDVTSRYRAEASRARLEAQLRQAQKLEAIGTLAGGIAHDFNNILAAILGYGEMAQREAAPASAQRRHIDAALAAALRAKSLVERILAFSRSGVGERVPVHVQSVVEEALQLVAASLPAGIALEHRVDAGDAAVLGDATQIHQVVMNLCANAAQAMRAGGTLAVQVDTATLAEPQVVTTATLQPGRHVRLVVRDSGVGIAPRVLDRIFDPFFTTRDVGVGTGLGLSLVHGIVTDLDGGIDVHSELGSGTTMTVYLPYRHTAAAPAGPAGAEPPGHGETVMIVDDEEDLVRMGEEMMAELGYEPVGFASSAAALASFRAMPDRYSVVLSDEAMPELTGSELAREIRRLRPDIGIVLMSGYVTPALSARAQELGGIEVLNKPLAMDDIARSIARALRVPAAPPR